MTTRTQLERMWFSLEITKKFIEENIKFNSNDYSIDDVILKFIVIRDYPFLEDWEVQSVMDGVKMMIEMYVAEQEIKERKEHEEIQ